MYAIRSYYEAYNRENDNGDHITLPCLADEEQVQDAMNRLFEK